MTETAVTPGLEVSSLTRRRWIAAGAAMVLLLLAACGGAALAYRAHVAYRVFVNGTEVGMIDDPGIIEKAVADEARARSLDPSLARLVGKITTEPVHSVLRPKTIAEEELRSAISGRVSFQLVAAQIVVDGKVVATVKDEGTAKEVLKRMQDDYLASIGATGEGVTVESVEVAQDVDIRVVPTDPGAIATDLDKLVTILERGTDRVETHTVAKGETLWGIAQENGMTEDEILKANPGVNPKALQVGQAVSLVVPTPFVTFRDTEVRVQKQSIPYATKTVKDPELNPWQRVTRQSGRSGVKEVTTEIQRENGRVVSTTLVKTEVLREPTEAIVAIGSKPVVANGTGEFIWPTNGGVITSPFGWRWGRLHTGTDIGVPVGTPVYAADSGTVIAAGSDGAYGRRVIIYHGNGRSTLYAHLSVIKVSPGDKVKQGQIIGLSGQSGDATGPHLHFEVLIDGKPVDAMKYFH